MLRVILKQHQSNNSSIFIGKNSNICIQNQGFINKDSPLKAVFRGISPKKSLSPLKGKNQKRKNINNLSPHRANNVSPSNFNVQRNTPLIVSTRKQALFSVQNYLEDNDNIRSPRNNLPLKSFRQVSQRNSELINDSSFQNSIGYRNNPQNSYVQNFQVYNKKDQNSTYQNTQRNPKSNTKIFSQLLSDLQFNRANSKSQYGCKNNQQQFIQMRRIRSDDNHQYKNVNKSPQTQTNALNFKDKNEQNNNDKRSFKKITIKNVQTIQSIQSPQQFDVNQNNLYQPFMKKKSSKQQFKKQQFKQEQGIKIDFDLNNSFGSTIKKNEGETKKFHIQINPFQQIEREQQYKDKQTTAPFKQIKLTQIKPFAYSESFSLQLSSLQKNQILGSIDKRITQSIYEQEDSQLGAFKVIIDHIAKKQVAGSNESKNILESVNVSKDSNEDSLNMNPFL